MKKNLKNNSFNFSLELHKFNQTYSKHNINNITTHICTKWRKCTREPNLCASQKLSLSMSLHWSRYDILKWETQFSFLLSSSGPFRDCFQVRQAGHSTSGMYLLKTEGSDRLIQAWCEHKLDNGGWTVFQRRKDGSVNFFRNWENYKVKGQSMLQTSRHAKLRQSFFYSFTFV